MGQRPHLHSFQFLFEIANGWIVTFFIEILFIFQIVLFQFISNRLNYSRILLMATFLLILTFIYCLRGWATLKYIGEGVLVKYAHTLLSVRRGECKLMIIDGLVDLCAFWLGIAAKYWDLVRNLNLVNGLGHSSTELLTDLLSRLHLIVFILMNRTVGNHISPHILPSID